CTLSPDRLRASNRVPALPYHNPDLSAMYRLGMTSYIGAAWRPRLAEANEAIRTRRQVFRY
ncbi:MAG: hypothetical protein Q8L92_03235, partial [Rubrivivax sp.]|nr:hypothetical protein [Rubrivivax sp.]